MVNDNNYMETTPSPKASPVYQRLRKGLRPSVSMSTIPEEDSHQSSSVARQVFPEENPSATVPESEAKAAEDIPAASADEETRREERVATPPVPDQVILEENVTVQYPPVIDHMEVENVETATNTPEANDHVLAEDRVEPEANAVPEANENLEASATPVPTDGAVPPPRPQAIGLHVHHPRRRFTTIQLSGTSSVS